MTARRILYLGLVGLMALFYLMYRQWLSWLALVMVLVMPLVSLVISLPAMLTAKVRLRCPGQVRIGVPAKTTLEVTSPFPAPPVHCVLKLRNRLSGEVYTGYPGEYVPVHHCGIMEITYRSCYICDYLGLFARKVRLDTPYKVLVEPKPVPGALPEIGGMHPVTGWKPKPGGGFAENHELRLYRPGDDLRQIHFKLSAKTGKLIYREPMVPLQEQVSLILTLSGSPRDIDRKLGQLVWSSNYLLQKQINHHIRCCAAGGEMSFCVTDPDSQQQALHALLAAEPTQGEWIPQGAGSPWQHLVGGAPDEG